MTLLHFTPDPHPNENETERLRDRPLVSEVDMDSLDGSVAAEVGMISIARGDVRSW